MFKPVLDLVLRILKIYYDKQPISIFALSLCQCYNASNMVLSDHTIKEEIAKGRREVMEVVKGRGIYA